MEIQKRNTTDNDMRWAVTYYNHYPLKTPELTIVLKFTFSVLKGSAFHEATFSFWDYVTYGITTKYITLPNCYSTEYGVLLAKITWMFFLIKFRQSLQRTVENIMNRMNLTMTNGSHFFISIP